MHAMAKVNYIHSEEARQDWQIRPITYQMGNIGSEVSRSLKWTEKGNLLSKLTLRTLRVLPKS